STRTSRTACSTRCALGRRRRTWPNGAVIETAAPGLVPPTLIARYRPQDLSVFDTDERKRFLDPFGETALDALAGNLAAWEHIAPFVAWELLYRLEPELYDRLIAGERIH